MAEMQRTKFLAVFAFAVGGAAIGLLTQMLLSARGQAPLVPPISLALTLVVIAGILITFGIALRRAVTRKSRKPVNPFRAVRLLAAARAGQFSGALIGGFGGGLALQLLSRSVMPPASTWLPMVLVLIAGVVLVVCGVITEMLCRVPPSDGDDDSEREGGLHRRNATRAEPDAA